MKKQLPLGREKAAERGVGAVRGEAKGTDGAACLT